MTNGLETKRTVDNIDHDYYAQTVFVERNTPRKRFKRNKIDLFNTADCVLVAVEIDQPSTSSEDVKRRSLKRNTNDKVSAPNALDIHTQLCSESLENMVVTILDDSVNTFLKTIVSWNTILLDMLRKGTSFDKCQSM